MPQVNKQVPRPVPKNGESVLDRIRPVGEVPDKGYKLNVYGLSKTGKTRMACTFPKPLLLIGTEDGTLSVKSVKGVDFVRIHTTQELLDLAEHAKTRYRSVVLDTAGGLQDILLMEVVGYQQIPVQRTWGIATQEHWGVINTKTKECLKRLFDLAENHRINTVIIAHERDFTKKDSPDPNVSELERTLPKVGSALTPGVKGWLDGECDYICQTFINHTTVTEMQKVEVNGQMQEVPVASKRKKEYCLRIGPHNLFTTGFRVDGAVELPDFIVDPTFEKIAQVAKRK